MREYDLAPGVSAQRVADNQTHRRPPRFMRVVEHRLRQRWVDQPLVDRMRRVHENDRFPLTQLRPNGLERFVAQIPMPLAVAREQRHAICVQDVKGVSDLGEASGGVEERGQGGEKAVASWVFLLEGGGVLVALTR